MSLCCDYVLLDWRYALFYFATCPVRGCFAYGIWPKDNSLPFSRDPDIVRDTKLFGDCDNISTLTRKCWTTCKTLAKSTVVTHKRASSEPLRLSKKNQDATSSGILLTLWYTMCNVVFLVSLLSKHLAWKFFRTRKVADKLLSLPL